MPQSRRLQATAAVFAGMAATGHCAARKLGTKAAVLLDYQVCSGEFTLIDT